MQKSHELKTFARMESDSALRLGLSFRQFVNNKHFVHDGTAVKLVLALL